MEKDNHTSIHMPTTKGNNTPPNILPMGAARGSNPANQEHAQNGTLGIGAHRLYIEHERLRHLDSNITGKTLPEIFSVDRHDIESGWIDDNMVIIVNYKSAALFLEAACFKGKPFLTTYRPITGPFRRRVHPNARVLGHRERE